MPHALIFPALAALSAVLALSLVGFLLGEKLSVSALRAHGGTVIAVTLGETLASLIAVLLALLALTAMMRSLRSRLIPLVARQLAIDTETAAAAIERALSQSEPPLD